MAEVGSSMRLVAAVPNLLSGLRLVLAVTFPAIPPGFKQFVHEQPLALVVSSDHFRL